MNVLQESLWSKWTIRALRLNDSEAIGLGKLGVITLTLMVPPEQASNGEWLWVMCDNIAKALEQLGWVNKTRQTL